MVLKDVVAFSCTRDRYYVIENCTYREFDINFEFFAPVGSRFVFFEKDSSEVLCYHPIRRTSFSLFLHRDGFHKSGSVYHHYLKILYR